MPELFETQERTEEATPKRQEESRQKGQFARSADLSTAVILLSMAGLLLGFGPTLLQRLARGIVESTARLAAPPTTSGDAVVLLNATMNQSIGLAGPFLACAAAAALILHFVQAGGFIVVRDALGFKPEKLDVVQNFARLLSLRNWVKLATGLVKAVVVCAVVWYSLRSDLPTVGALSEMALESATSSVGALLMKLFLRATGALLVLGGLDWLFQRWQTGRDLRMSKQDIRDEHKNEDGDPQQRRRFRDRMRHLIEKPLRDTVRTATVVITNPTHFAVALEYVEGKSAAPTVVAKGADHVAQEIRRLARDANVPVIEQPPLARALFRQVPVGAPIPEALFRAVASVLAIVWRLREERARRNSRKPSRPAAKAAPKPVARAAGRGK